MMKKKTKFTDTIIYEIGKKWCNPMFWYIGFISIMNDCMVNGWNGYISSLWETDVIFPGMTIHTGMLSI